MLLAISTSLLSVAVPVAITVPYSATPVADANLDGDPATGAWADALSVVVTLENGQAAPYGTAMLYAKHDGTNLYLRLDGAIDVDWVSAGGDHFWVGFQVSPADTNHHGGGTWDGVFLGLWNGAEYTPTPTYPPPAVDTFGFVRPPVQDATQDVLGALATSGAANPFDFTAEWKRPLNSGDVDDLVYVADGTTTYNFFVTTDSNGGGSANGGISHRGMTNLNTMRIEPVGTPNTPPSVDLTAPDGGEDWTGASAHNIRWNASDTEDAVSALLVWLNYSLNDGASYSPISGAQGISCPANPCAFSWMTPPSDTAIARVRATVVDTGGLSAGDASVAPFTLDSSPPTVTGTLPADGTLNVPPTTAVDVTFNELMRQTVTETAFTLRRDDTGGLVAGTFGWAATTMTFTPTVALAQGVSHTGRVDTTASDDSDPGNLLTAPFAFTFTTLDGIPPEISLVSATPPLQESGGSVNVTANVTDNGMVSVVRIEYTDPNSIVLGNFSMTRDGGTGLYYHEAVYTTPGTYSFDLSARDAAGNWNATTGSFAVQDTTPPAIVHTPPGGAAVGISIPLDATATDNHDILEVRVNYTDVLGVNTNDTMVRSGSDFSYSIPGQPSTGNVTYYLWGVDPSGNGYRTADYTVPVSAVDTTPPTITPPAATPPVSEVFFPVNVSAGVTDNIAVRSVFIEVWDPAGGSLGNVSMTRRGTTYFLVRTYSDLGTHPFVIWANDTSGNYASASGQFEVRDTTPPALGSPTATPSPQEAGQTVAIALDVTDNFLLQEVTVAILDPDATLVGNFTMALSGGLYRYSSSFVKVGTYDFTVWARDSSSNFGSAVGQFAIQDTTPPTIVATGGGTYWIGTQVTFDASGSSDVSGIANVTWSFQYDSALVNLYGVARTFTFDIPGTYSVNLTVIDGAGLSAYEILSVEIITDTTAPDAPTMAAVVPTTPGCLLVSWNPVQATDLAGYRPYRWNSSRGEFDPLGDIAAGTTSFEDCNLAYDTVYTYWVLAFDDSGNESPPSLMMNGRTTSPLDAGFDAFPYQFAIVVLVAFAFVLGLLLLRKRRPPNESLPTTGKERDRAP